MDDARERHNRVVADLTERLVASVDNNPIEGMIVLESVLVSVLHHFHPDARVASGILDSMRARAVERLPR
jgi:hypothetical protein